MASDTVDHALLLTKLRNYGIRGDELGWFTSYLTDRTQSVSLENVTSDSMDISYGVPQGSILGPLLLHLDILERLQKRAGRMVLGIPSRTSTREVYDKLNWTNLRTRWKINRCLTVHKCLNSNVPEYLSNHFTRSDHRHSTRTSTSGIIWIYW